MICAKCGKEIPDESVRCNYCGAKVKIKKENNSNNKVIVILAIVIALLAIAFAAYVFLGSRNDKDSFTSDNVEELSKSVVRVECYDPEGSLYCTGSGVVVFDNQTVVTNYHVISGNCLSATITSDDGQSANVESILAYDENKDLAILKLEAPTSITPLVIGDSSVLARGNEVLAIGSPLGLLNTASTGIVSGFVEDGDIKAIQTTAPISSGSSGGALLNSKGELIGITYSGILEGQNLGFAIPVNDVVELHSSNSNQKTFEQFYKSIVHEIELDDFLQNFNKYSKDFIKIRIYGYVSSTGSYTNNLAWYSDENTEKRYIIYIVSSPESVLGLTELDIVDEKEVFYTKTYQYDFISEIERNMANESLRLTNASFGDYFNKEVKKFIAFQPILAQIRVGDYVEFEYVPTGYKPYKIISINGKSIG